MIQGGAHPSLTSRWEDGIEGSYVGHTEGDAETGGGRREGRQGEVPEGRERRFLVLNLVSWERGDPSFFFFFCLFVCLIPTKVEIGSLCLAREVGGFP